MAYQDTKARPRAFVPGQNGDRQLPLTQPSWDIGPERRIDDGKSLARGLGFFSLALGAAEVLMPDRLSDFLGLDEEHSGLIRFYGFREIASGVAILATGRRPAAGVWSRVAGDAVDLGSLGAALGKSDRPGRVAGAMAMVAGVTALDVLAARQLGAAERGELR